MKITYFLFHKFIYMVNIQCIGVKKYKVGYKHLEDDKKYNIQQREIQQIAVHCLAVEFHCLR